MGQDSLAISLTREQIAAANRIHDQLSNWSLVDRALERLSKNMSGFDRESILLKAAAVNQLYYTNVFAIVPMAEHMANVLNEPGAVSDHGLVDRLAVLSTNTRQAQRRFVSFASKFAHFFVDPDRFPIFDSFGLHMIKLHLGVRKDIWRSTQPYAEFLEMFRRVQTLACPTCTNRELDRYLWVAGQYRAWMKNSKAQINGELRSVFQNQTGQLKTVLMPEGD